MKQPITSTFFGKRYEIIGTIGSGGMGTVYRAMDRLTGDTVALKAVTAAGDDLMFSSKGATNDYRLSLAQEFKTLSSLRHPNIISVLDYGFTADKQPFFTMEFIENAKNVVKATQGLTFDDKIQYIVQILQALVYLHRRKIIHRDLKPDNVLVIDNQVKVLDFGLATARDLRSTSSQNQEEIVGTLAYMAPEVLRGASATESSDLYAVGVIAFEIIAGTYPFDTSNINTMVINIINGAIDIDKLDTPEPLRIIVRRLLHIDKHDRYQEAQTVIDDLSSAMGRELVRETQTIRESFLQAADFVGRDQEMTTLSSALADALAGKGSAWLVGGESGIGKSRLLTELRTQALVRGVPVFTGQAVSEGGAPYTSWRNVIRRMILQTELSDLEASVLKTIVPNIDKLIGRDVLNAPAIEAQSAQARLLSVVEELFRRQDQTVLVLLEDLHWAGPSLTILNHLTRDIQDIPLMIVGSYRTDEAPDLPAEIHNTQVITLDRLTREEIVSLSTSMLGVEVGAQASVVDLIHRETEGNVLFIVEVVRTLAEEAGQLSDIATMTLPVNVLAEGIQAVVERRIKRLPSSARGLLKIAALAGRELDLKVLQAIIPAIPIEVWLATCSNYQIIEVQDQRWTFSHDKLRDALLAESEPEEIRNLHLQIAQGIEEAHANNLSLYYALLAYHWEQTGNTLKTLEYVEKAGELAVSSYAQQEIIYYFQKAQEVYAHLQFEDPTSASAIDLLRRAKWALYVGEAYVNWYRFDEGRRYLEQGLQLLGHKLPSGNIGVGLTAVKQIVTQFFNRMLPQGIIARSTHQRDALLLASRTYLKMVEVYYQTDVIPLSFLSNFRALNLADRAGESGELAESIVTLGSGLGFIPLHRIASSYLNHALRIAEKPAYARSRPYVWLAYAYYRTGIGDWDTAIEYFKQLREMSRASGDERRYGDAIANLAHIMGLRGEYDDALLFTEELYVSGTRRGIPRFVAEAMCERAQYLIYKGEHEIASIELTRLQTLLDSPDSGINLQDAVNILVRMYALRAILHLRNREYELAVENATKAEIITAKSALPTNYNTYVSYAFPPEVYLTLWARDFNIPDLHQRAEKAIKSMNVYAKSFNIGKPHACLVQGNYEWLKGNPDKAREIWGKGVQFADDLDLPYEQASLYFEIGRRSEKSHERVELLARAQELFAQLGAQYDEHRTKEVLGT